MDGDIRRSAHGWTLYDEDDEIVGSSDHKDGLYALAGMLEMEVACRHTDHRGIGCVYRDGHSDEFAHRFELQPGEIISGIGLTNDN